MGMSQQHLFRQVNITLPSPECYRLLQDRRGIMWIATEQGLCRFDGQTTKVYTSKEGIAEKAVYALRQDEAGIIWMISKTGRILQVQNDKVIDPGFDSLLQDKKMIHLGYDFFFLKNEMIIPVGYSSAVSLDKNKKTLEKITKNHQPEHSLIIHDQQQVIPFDISWPFSDAEKKQFIRYQDNENPARNRLIELPIENFISSQIITCKLRNRVFFSIASTLVEIDSLGELKVHHFPHRILSLLADSKKGLWVGVLGHGIQYYENGDLSRQPVKSLHELSVSNILEDREKHIWCATLEKGVYLCQQPGLLAFSDFNGLNRRVDFLKGDHGEFLASSRFNEIVTINARMYPRKISLSGSAGEMITAIHRFSDQWLIEYNETLCIGSLENNKLTMKKSTGYKNPGSLLPEEFSNTMYGHNYNAVYAYKNGNVQLILENPSQHFLTFLPLAKDTFLVATADSLQLISIFENKARIRNMPLPTSPICRLLYAEKSKRVFVLTKGSGIFEWKNEKLVDCNEDLKITTGVLHDVIEDYSGNLWIATNEGILKCAYNGKKFEKPELYNEKHGFPSEVCNKIAFNGKHIAVSTSEGLIVFPATYNFQPAIAPQLIFNEAQVNGKTVDLQTTTLKPKENSIHFYFSVPSYHQAQGQSVFYTLLCGGIAQKGISGTDILLQNLEPGAYHLKVVGQNAYGIRSGECIDIKFVILSPFWQTWWFIVLCIACGMSVLTVLFFLIKRRTEYRAEQSNRVKIQLAQSRLSALQAQMNPHFIFNSITSIQNFIMSNKRDEAYDYLTSFSKLIRRTLNNSRSPFITLAEELETLKLYMELEQRRYKNKFDFHLKLNEEIIPGNIQLPASMIQPLLENAVWHGVGSLNHQTRGLIKLEITTEANYLRVAVTDNGVGIRERDSSHKSLAIIIIEEQLALITEGTGKNWQPYVTLTTGIDGYGTEASFKIPIIMKE